MLISTFLKGLLIGFSIAAPVGPIGVLCIHRTLSHGRQYGLLTGLGAATADALYGCVAAFGLTLISSFLVEQQTWFRLVGGVFLCYLGVRTLFSKAKDRLEQAKPASLVNAYGSTFFLTLTNPVTILAFAAIFAGIGLANPSAGYVSAAITVLGVFLGSSSWWLILSTITSLFRDRLTVHALVWVNRLSGLVILAFGIAALISIVRLIQI